MAGEILRGNESDDVILGDEGILRYDGSYVGTIGSMSAWRIPRLNEPTEPRIIATTDPTLGAGDWIFGNADDDIVMGGTADDVIIGDNEETVTGSSVYDFVEADPGQDILIGDQGRMTLENAVTTVAHHITRIESTDVLETNGDGDYIEGNDLSDLLIGGVDGATPSVTPDILIGESSLPTLVGTLNRPTRVPAMISCLVMKA